MHTRRRTETGTSCNVTGLSCYVFGLYAWTGTAPTLKIHEFERSGQLSGSVVDGVEICVYVSTVMSNLAALNRIWSLHKTT